MIKTFLLTIAFLTLAQTAFAASTVGTTRISTDSFPEFTFQIPIPGFDRTFNLCQTAADGKLECHGIARYISAIYRWLIGIAAVLAVLAIAWGGVQWLISRGESGKIQEARKVIGNAIIGLLLALGSYGILATIGKDYVTFKPIRIEQVDPLQLKLAELRQIPPTSSRATRAAKTTRTSLPTSMNKDIFTASCTLECNERGVAQGAQLEAVVSEKAGAYECGCKEKNTGALCQEPDTHLSKKSDCSDVCPVGNIIPPNEYVLSVKEKFAHNNSAGGVFYCCSCVVTPSPPLCGSRNGQQCCGITGGDLECGAGLYPVQKTTFAPENKCFCYSGNEGAVCNAEIGTGCASGLVCQKIKGTWVLGAASFITGDNSSLPSREDGECKRK